MATNKTTEIVQEELSTENWVEKEFSSLNKTIRLATSFKRDKSIFNDEVSTFGDLLDAFKGDNAFANSFSTDFVSRLAD